MRGPKYLYFDDFVGIMKEERYYGVGLFQIFIVLIPVFAIIDNIISSNQCNS